MEINLNPFKRNPYFLTAAPVQKRRINGANGIFGQCRIATESMHRSNNGPGQEPPLALQERLEDMQPGPR
jgi:hypothetical protein